MNNSKVYVDLFGVVLDRKGIETLLPHQDFALEHLDGVILFDRNTPVLDTCKFADPDWYVFRGHYPGMPVVPAHNQLECAFMTMALLYGFLYPDMANQSLPMARKILNFDFKRSIHPGDDFIIRAHEPTIAERRVFLSSVVITNFKTGKEIASGRLGGMRQDGKRLV